LYQNTSLYFKASGDGSELFEHNLPTPHYYHRYNKESYAISWVIDGFFHTKKGIAFLNDIIARISLSMPIQERYEHEPVYEDDRDEILGYQLKAFQNAKSMRSEYAKQAVKYENNVSRDMVWWSIKYQAESFIRQFDGWFNYQLLEDWAVSLFLDHVKDKSTLKAKCRATWHWYEQRNFTIPKTDRGFTMSRQEAGKATAKKKAEATKAKVIGAIESLKFLQEKINIANVAKQAGVSRNTAKKYLQELGLI
jgi:NACalpha-BTF3-like transcription factor